MVHVYGECSLNAAIAATNSLIVNGKIAYSELVDPGNTDTLTFESVDSYERYVRLSQWLLPVVLVLSSGCCLLFLDLCLFSDNSLRNRVSSYRKRSFLRGVLLCSGSVAAATLLLTRRFTGLHTSQLLSFSGTPNFYYAAQLTLCQWIFATGLMYVGHSLYIYEDQVCRSMEAFVLALLAFFCSSNLPQDDAGSQARQVIGCLLLLITSCLLSCYQQVVIWSSSWEEVYALNVMENYMHNAQHSDYQKKKEDRSVVRKSASYVQNYGSFLDTITAKIRTLLITDVLLVVSLFFLYDTDAASVFRPALVQVDNPECAAYWPLLVFVVLGFSSVLFTFFKSLQLLLYRSSYKPTPQQEIGFFKILVAYNTCPSCLLLLTDRR